MRIIKTNRARCRKCNTIAESMSRHHLSFCECGSIYVDGGTAYLRRGGEIANIEELSEFTEEVKNEPEREKRTI